MKSLQEILNEYRNSSETSDLYHDLAVFAAIDHLALNLVENVDFVRVFPKNGSHYIDVLDDYGIDDRGYVVLSQLYDLGLTNYIDRIRVHEGTLQVGIKSAMYSISEVEAEFDRILKYNIRVLGDEWNYEIRKSL